MTHFENKKIGVHEEWDDEKRLMLYLKSDPVFVPFYYTIQMLLFS
jgi:hypothetical protein